MTATNNVPRILTEHPADGSYRLSYTQRERRKRGESIWQRDHVVEPYEVRKGKFV